jgi:hypothetical protein
VEIPTSPLSSRPERSGAEGPAVPLPASWTWVGSNLEFDSRKVRLLLFIAFSRLKPVVKAGLTGQFRMTWTNARRSNTQNPHPDWPSSVLHSRLFGFGTQMGGYAYKLLDIVVLA